MSNASSRRNANRTLTRVWTCVLVLALLAVVSLSSVGAYAATYASRDPEVLFLDTATEQELTSTMDLFKNAYVNASGQTVVASADGTKIVAPGTSGSYEFAVRNSGGQPATYRVWAETEQAGTTQVIPLQVSLASGQRACQNLADAGELAPGNSAIYSIAWEWPFEEGQTTEARAASDVRDTTLGNAAATARASYTVTLHMTAEADYAPANGGTAPNTGEQAMPVALLVIAAALLIVVAVFMRRRNKDDQADSEDAR